MRSQMYKIKLSFDDCFELRITSYRKHPLANPSITPHNISYFALENLDQSSQRNFSPIKRILLQIYSHSTYNIHFENHENRPSPFKK